MKKKIIVFSVLLVLTNGVAYTQVGIGTAAPASSSLLDLSSTTRGLLAPRMTSTQRTAIATPADGLLVYDTNTKSMWVYKTAVGWANMSDFSIPFSGTYSIAGALLSLDNAGTGLAISARASGMGTAVNAIANGSGNSVEAFTLGSGDALYALVSNTSTGRAGYFNTINPDNTNDVITARTTGNGIAGNFKVDKISGTSPAVKGEVNSQFANFGTAGVFGESKGTGGYGGVFQASNAAGLGPALVATTNGNGDAIRSTASGNGYGIISTIEGTGIAVYGVVSGFSNGRAARFINLNPANSNATLSVETRGTGPLAVFSAGSPAENVARISATGRGFFNGGTQASGADVAEAFDVEGNIDQYEPGDVLVISTSTDRTVEKSSEAYSTLVVGVYATKPGVLLTDENINTDISDKVSMGVIGVIPTKVCLEGGEIKRGDLLVCSSTPGVAMKADINKVKPGQVIGKALQPFNESIVAKINVLVNVK